MALGSWVRAKKGPWWTSPSPTKRNVARGSEQGPTGKPNHLVKKNRGEKRTLEKGKYSRPKPGLFQKRGERTLTKGGHKKTKLKQKGRQRFRDKTKVFVRQTLGRQREQKKMKKKRVSGILPKPPKFQGGGTNGAIP